MSSWTVNCFDVYGNTQKKLLIFYNERFYGKLDS